MHRRLVLFFVLLLVSSASGREEDTPPTSLDRPPAEQKESDVTRDQVDSIARGLEWLSHRQGKDGAWNQENDSTIAVTSLVVLAFMANGNTENRGRYSKQVRKGVKFLLRHVTMTPMGRGSIPVGYIWIKGDDYSRMHGHGYATTVLALAYGMGNESRRAEIRTRLELAVNLIERSQHETGGWWYMPTPERHEGSVTVCEVQALRSAREAGIKVSKGVVDRAIRYLELSQDADTGGFCYSLSDRKRQTFALTAAALSTLFGLGGYHRAEMIDQGLNYMKLHGRRRFLSRQMWFFYGNFYAAQSLWQAGGDERFAHHWRDWWPGIRDHLIEAQSPVGKWVNPGGNTDIGVTDIYATAMGVLILEVPLAILPMFQR